jgi:hypothetical protein
MGYAILAVDMQPGSNFHLLSKYGTEHVENYKTNPNPSDVPDYDKVKTAQNVAIEVLNLVVANQVEMVVIEQTNPGKFRTAQKELEFIHFAVVNMLQQHKEITKKPLCVKYIDTSKWRSLLGIKLTKEQRVHNKAVKNKIERGKITPKHLAVAWVNQKYNLDLLKKDHDAADAICMATCAPFLVEKKCFTSVESALGIKNV